MTLAYNAFEAGFEEFDPLLEGAQDQEIILAGHKRDIQNILKSYTGWYDLFSEMIQNALDAIDRRRKENIADYQPTLWMTINLNESTISITDNGCGMTKDEFKQFLRPHISFNKDGITSRGSKGVGATYLAYGFNYLEAASKHDGYVSAGILLRGREWVEEYNVPRPKVVPIDKITHEPFYEIDRGTTFTVKLVGLYIRPKDLSYTGATNADQWHNILCIKTPLGGIYLGPSGKMDLTVNLDVVTRQGTHDSLTTSEPEYIYPHTVLGRTEDIRAFINYQNKRAQQGKDTSQLPAKYTELNGIWGAWSGEEILEGKGLINPQINAEEKALLKDLGIHVYAFIGYTTDLWDIFNDKKLGLRESLRILRGGLQLATRNMTQGELITIPLTRNVGQQNVSHVIIHLRDADPDLGRKGFQPEIVELARKIASAAVRGFEPYHKNMLKKKTGAPPLLDSMEVEKWVDEQKEYEKQFPLRVTGKGLFMPTEELAIRSYPQVEQDVVALFNQMLTSGLIRGLQLLSSSQHKQYDGIYRVVVEPPFEKYILGEINPLGVNPANLPQKEERVEFSPQILEYKFSLDGLIEEFQTEEKDHNVIDLAIAWEMGTKWTTMFNIVSYLDPQNTHHRFIHGTTHSFFHSAQNTRAFEAIILKDLVQYLANPEDEIKRQEQLYSDEIEL